MVIQVKLHWLICCYNQ